jgi:hypothetical protein
MPAHAARGLEKWELHDAHFYFLSLFVAVIAITACADVRHVSFNHKQTYQAGSSCESKPAIVTTTRKGVRKLLAGWKCWSGSKEDLPISSVRKKVRRL